jgi:hypothetical protein
VAYREYKNVERNVPDGAEDLTIESCIGEEEKASRPQSERNATQGNGSDALFG